MKNETTLEQAWTSFIALPSEDKIRFIRKMEQFGKDLNVECILMKQRMLEEIEKCKVDDTHVFDLEYVKKNSLGL